jgi:hypothetical protein
LKLSFPKKKEAATCETRDPTQRECPLYKEEEKRQRLFTKEKRKDRKEKCKICGLPDFFS